MTNLIKIDWELGIADIQTPNKYQKILTDRYWVPRLNIDPLKNHRKRVLGPLKRVNTLPFYHFVVAEK